MVKNFVGNGAQPCIPRWQTTILTAFFQLFLSALIKRLLGTIILSLCGHYDARLNPDQDVGLFGPNQHWPHC